MHNTTQQKIMRRVAGLFALADQLELRLEKARSRVRGITPSLSKDNYEPTN